MSWFANAKRLYEPYLLNIARLGDSGLSWKIHDLEHDLHWFQVELKKKMQWWNLFDLTGSASNFVDPTKLDPNP